MSGKIKYTTGLLIVMSFLCGCKHYTAFSNVECDEGSLIADEQNAAYDDSAVASSKENNQVKASAKKTEDLSVPDPKVEDIAEDMTYAVPGKTTPLVITDMDLTEMDGAQTKIIKPTSQTKMILPVITKKVVQNHEDTHASPSVFYLAETVYFSDGSSSVDNSYAASLRKVVKEAKAHNGKIIVQGFASSRTRNTDIMTHKMANLKVSTARAENIAQMLIRYGMPKSRVITEGLSDSRPVYQEVMPEGERLNRRAEIYISY